MDKLLDAPLQQDLHALSVYWWQQQRPHRIAEQAGRQVVWIEDPAQAAQMRAEYEAFVSGELKLTLRQREPAQAFDFIGLFRNYPVTLSLVVLSVIGFALVELGFRDAVAWLQIQGTDHVGARLSLDARIAPDEYLAHGQYWRLVTPIFLHFGWVHITFNMLWLWELGRRIEHQGGAVHFISVVFFIAVASNLYQAAATPMASFGGMSGVIYGLLGYCAVYSAIMPRSDLRMPLAIYVLMLGSLVVGWLGIFDFLARMANTAHLSGLIFGVIIGLPSALVMRYIK